MIGLISATVGIAGSILDFSTAILEMKNIRLEHRLKNKDENRYKYLTNKISKEADKIVTERDQSIIDNAELELRQLIQKIERDIAKATGQRSKSDDKSGLAETSGAIIDHVEKSYGKEIINREDKDRFWELLKLVKEEEGKYVLDRDQSFIDNSQYELYYLLCRFNGKLGEVLG